MGVKLKLGSLFDGSGGFPLAGVMNGIEPVWASEIEPFPIRVTHKRFPHMKHLGSVTKINGADIEPVDIITFGSPCQDLSIAGNRAGIHKGERSNLFFEAVRIIKEMRNATNGEYPRFAVWENVMGAFSSNRGEDFRCVLEALCRVTDESVSIPRPEKWLHAGCVKWGGRAWHTVSTTRCTGEFPSVARECFLWQTLEDNAPTKYFLSPAACRGIMLRAEKRDRLKTMPVILRKALEQTIAREQSCSRNAQESRGGGQRTALRQ